jgi:hypothetical protein
MKWNFHCSSSVGYHGNLELVGLHIQSTHKHNEWRNLGYL